MQPLKQESGKYFLANVRASYAGLWALTNRSVKVACICMAESSSNACEDKGSLKFDSIGVVEKKTVSGSYERAAHPRAICPSRGGWSYRRPAHTWSEHPHPDIANPAPHTSAVRARSSLILHLMQPSTSNDIPQIYTTHATQKLRSTPRRTCRRPSCRQCRTELPPGGGWPPPAAPAPHRPPCPHSGVVRPPWAPNRHALCRL